MGSWPINGGKNDFGNIVLVYPVGQLADIFDDPGPPFAKGNQRVTVWTINTRNAENFSCAQLKFSALRVFMVHTVTRWLPFAKGGPGSSKISASCPTGYTKTILPKSFLPPLIGHDPIEFSICVMTNRPRKVMWSVLLLNCWMFCRLSQSR